MSRRHPHDAPIDTGLLERRFHEGDHDAFHVLAAPHVNTLYTMTLRMTGSAAEAEDIAQDALLRAMERHHLYRPGSPVRPWLLTIAMNLARGRLRSPWWRRMLPFGAAEDVVSGALELDAIGNDADAKVRLCLLELPPMYREALSLFYLEDMTYLEMSQITGQGVPALKQRVRRGKEMLRRLLDEMYPELAAERMDRAGGES